LEQSDFDGMMSVAVWLDDAVLLEPQLLKAYDEVLSKIDAETTDR
jgi:hypothetical protein